MYEKCERHQVVRVMTEMKRRREDYLDVDVSSLKNKVGLLVLTSRGGGTGEAEGAPFPGFGRSVNPISIKGGGRLWPSRYYSPPRFSDMPPFLFYLTSVFLMKMTFSVIRPVPLNKSQLNFSSPNKFVK